MIPLEDAQSFVIGACAPLSPVTVGFEAAEGLVLAAEVVAAEQVPPFENTAVDGYAVRAADTAAVPVEMPVVAEVAAGAAT
ncbi:molybdopterin molybdenumtransferase MoeA, partial [Bradyrhizobium sp. NBAIM08]|nr:molybdopterin molybdenumtransferase MoeA [Bradyrhizobium sp. NBAIM08]